MGSARGRPQSAESGVQLGRRTAQCALKLMIFAPIFCAYSSARIRRSGFTPVFRPAAAACDSQYHDLGLRPSLAGGDAGTAALLGCDAGSP